MKISVIYAACNQGEYLHETVESAVVGLEGCKDWEIIVVDDQSTDGCCDFLRKSTWGIDRIHLVERDKKLGVSHARHEMGLLSLERGADVIITSDAHCYYPRRSLYRMAKCWAMKYRAIIVPPVRMERGKDRYKLVEGGAFTVSSRGIRIDRPSRVREWPSLFGSIYLMRRDVWEHLGGWIRLPGYWGGEEQMMSIVAYRLGVPIRVLAEFDQHLCTHRQYRQHAEYPFPLPPEHPIEIAHYTHAACFPETYESIWGPLIKKRFPKYEPFKEDGQDPALLRDWINTRAVWDEHRFFRTVLGVNDIQEHAVVKERLDEG